MLPININIKDFMTAGKKEAEKLEKEQKKKRTSASMQSLTNQLLMGSVPQNPNSAPIQQGTMEQ